jgi:glycosyltransferase involved in cell wall biosynthesis
MLSVVIPAHNEEAAIQRTIEEIRGALSQHGIAHEIIVVNDGSTDRTGEIARVAGVTVVTHPSSGGYGRSIKDGISVSKYDLIGITDADGTYPNRRMADLFNAVAVENFDMAVGARTGPHYRGSLVKAPARRVFLWLSEYATGNAIDDVNSGLRVFRKTLALKYMHTISAGFSFTTTITLAAMLNGYFVKYIPIEYYARVGRSSHVRYWRDTLRSLQIIVQNILYYNPFKLFLLLVNFLLLVSAVCLGVFLWSASPKVEFLSGVMASVALVGAVVVAGIGLVANLVKVASSHEKHDA